MPLYSRFSSTEVRRRTYNKWTGFTSVEALAKAGFFFLGEGDTVQCFTCGIKLHSWKSTDNPILEHIQNSPSCEFIREKIRSFFNLNPFSRAPSYFTWDILFFLLEERKKISERVYTLEKISRRSIWGQDEVDDFSLRPLTGSWNSSLYSIPEEEEEEEATTQNREQSDPFAYHLFNYFNYE